MRPIFTVWLLILVFHGYSLPQGAEACSVCHSNLYRAWSESAHARAWTSPLFQEQLKTFGTEEFCGACHAPKSIWERVNLRKENQTAGTLLPAAGKGEDEEDYQAELRRFAEVRERNREEGVHCGSCHQIEVQRSTTSGEEFIGPYHSTEGHGGKEVTQFQDYRLCATCHGRPASDYQPSGYSGGREFHHDQALAFQFAFGFSDCSVCHMPRKMERLVQLSVFRDLPKREVGNHTFSGVRYQELKNALAMDVESGADGTTLILINQSVGHPVRISLNTTYRVQVSLTRKGATVESASVALSGAENLDRGQSLRVPLPFVVSEGDQLRVELFVQEVGMEEQKAYEVIL